MNRPATVHLVAAARPNFMKVAPLWHALKATDDFRPVIVPPASIMTRRCPTTSSPIWACPYPTIISASARAPCRADRQGDDRL